MSFQDFVEEHKGCSYSEEHIRPKGGTITHQEKGKEYRYEYNTGETFLKIHVDGGLVQDNTEKCDYLLLNTTGMETNKTNYHAIFIELKGSDIIKACKQLLETITMFSPMLKPANMHARIVVSKFKKGHTPKVIELQYLPQFKNKKCSFDHQTGQMVEHTGKDGHPTRK